MRTLLALIAAAAMIAGALHLRGGGGDGTGNGPLGSSEPAVLVCATELQPVCDALAEEDGDIEVRVEDAGRTAGTLAGADQVDADAWLTLAPWPEIVSQARQRDGAASLPPSDAGVLGRSPLVVVVAKERAVVLEQDCPDLSWRCIGASAGKNWTDLGGQEAWGAFKPGFADPLSNATGLLVLGQAASEYLNTSTFSTRDMEADRFRAWLDQLANGVAGHGSGGNTPLQDQLAFGVGKFDLVGTTEAEAGPRLARSQRGASLAIRYPKNLVVAEVVLAPLRDSRGAGRLRSLLEGSGKSALAKSGWRVEGQPAAQGVPSQPSLPEEANVPGAGVLDALRTRWEETAR